MPVVASVVDAKSAIGVIIIVFEVISSAIDSASSVVDAICSAVHAIGSDVEAIRKVHIHPVDKCGNVEDWSFSIG